MQASSEAGFSPRSQRRKAEGQVVESPPISGVAYMFFAAVMLGSMSTVTKMVFRGTLITALQISVTRSVVLAGGSYFFARRENVDVFSVPKKQAFNLFLRCIFGTVASVCQCASLQLLPLSLAMVLFWTQPISAILLSRIFMGETLSNMQIFSVAAAMFGVVLLTNP